MEGDRDLLSEIVQLFVSECPRTSDDLRQALEAQDAHVLERVAHTLKGSAANISATGLCQAALSLEMQARSGDLRDAPRQVDTIEEELDRLLVELEAWPAQLAHEV
jgi:HPt (histidine-containing phosphotransfer) domain-containing protein